MEYFAPFLRYAALMTVLSGIVFGVLTLIEWQRARYLNAAAELVRIIQNAEFTSAIRHVLELPASADAQMVLSDREAVAAAYVVGHMFESLGVMVFHRLLPLALVDHLVGGYVRASWVRLKPYIEARRVPLGPTFAEWFQWLAERMTENPEPERELFGAAAAYRNWRA